MGIKRFKGLKGFNVVYAFNSENGDCIYIGQSKDFIKRWYQHKDKSKFFNEINSTTIYIVESIPDMAFIEAQLILIIKPKYNSQSINGLLSNASIMPIQTLHFTKDGTLVA